MLGCAALGVAALAKDPLGLLGPLVAIAIAAALAGRLRPVRAWLPPVGVALMVVIGFGWYAVAALTEPAFLWYTVVDNHVLNVARMREFPDEDVPLSALEFLTAAGFGAFPWILAAAVAVGALVRARAWRDPAELPWVALAVWAVGVLALFTISPFKLPHYGLPAYPALALLAARAWRDGAPRPRGLIAAHLVALRARGGGLRLGRGGRWAGLHRGGVRRLRRVLAQGGGARAGLAVSRVVVAAAAGGVGGGGAARGRGGPGRRGGAPLGARRARGRWRR